MDPRYHDLLQRIRNGLGRLEMDMDMLGVVPPDYAEAQAMSDLVHRMETMLDAAGYFMTFGPEDDEAGRDPLADPQTLRAARATAETAPESTSPAG